MQYKLLPLKYLAKFVLITGGIDHYNRDASMMIFYVLHTELGFGVKRLKRFHRAFDAMQEQLKKRYEMDEIDTPWICEEKLRQAVFDIDDLMQEEKDEN